MRVPVFLLVVAFLGTMSCQKPKSEAPPLSRDQMVELMLEVYLAEARASLIPIPKDSAYRLFVAHQDSIMHHRGIQDSTLRKAYAYYLERPTELEAVYDAIIDSLSLREQRLREAPQHRP